MKTKLLQYKCKHLLTQVDYEYASWQFVQKFFSLNCYISSLVGWSEKILQVKNQDVEVSAGVVTWGLQQFWLTSSAVLKPTESSLKNCAIKPVAPTGVTPDLKLCWL